MKSNVRLKELIKNINCTKIIYNGVTIFDDEEVLPNFNTDYDFNYIWDQMLNHYGNRVIYKITMSVVHNNHFVVSVEGESKVKIFNSIRKMWWRPEYLGYTENEDEAGIYLASDVLSTYLGGINFNTNNDNYMVMVE